MDIITNKIIAMTRAADGHGVRQKKEIYLPRIKTLKDFRQNDVNT